MEEKAIIGLDLGGTKILSGLISHVGDVVGKPYTLPTGGKDPEKVIVDRIFTAIDKSLENANLKIEDISGIGIGATGPLDMKQGFILDCPFLPTLKNFPLSKTIHRRYGIPVYLDNDANCFALGEYFFGEGREYETVLGYTLGTGLGCGIVINGKVFSGATQLRVKWGHLPIKMRPSKILSIILRACTCVSSPPGWAGVRAPVLPRSSPKPHANLVC